MKGITDDEVSTALAGDLVVLLAVRVSLIVKGFKSKRKLY
jgi:hypothetical protein